MKHWWEGYPWRMIQTNLREIDMEDIDAEKYAQELKEFGATVVTLNAGGIIASYNTQLGFQHRSEYLHGDSLSQIIDACHARGIRVIARMDFSKIRYPIYEQHPDWAYRDRNGDILNYNGYVQTCLNGEYQQEKMLEILEEVLTTHPFDGVFCNMSGFLVVDYSGVYHGPCHCENCKRMFNEQQGLDVPQIDNPRDPEYHKYATFKAACTTAHRKHMIETIKGISEELAINGLDYIRTESNTEIGIAQWQYSASSNSRLTAGPFRSRPSDNASVDFLSFRYRNTSVSPSLMAMRQWQNLANSGCVSLYIMGRLDNHRDISGYGPTKKVFNFHKTHERLFTELTSAAEVLLLNKGIMARNDPEVYGWIRALTSSHIPFDEVKLTELNEALLVGKKLVILGDAKSLSATQAVLLDAFAERGGMVLASGQVGKNGMGLKCLGIKGINKQERGLMSSVFEVTEADKTVFPRCAEAPFIAPGSDIILAEYEECARKYLRLIPEPPFGPPERCYYTEVTNYPGVIVNSYGSGHGVHVPWLAGSFYFNEGYQNTLNFIQDVLFSLCGLSEIAPDLTPMVELVLCKRENQIVVQLVNETGCFGNSYFTPIPVHNVQLVIPGVTGKAKALNGGEVICAEKNGKLEITLDVLNDYEAIVID